jgi:uncharacterized cupin superfamily protein
LVSRQYQEAEQMSNQSHSQCVNVDDVPSTEFSYGQRFQVTRKQLGMAAGGRKLGCTLVELLPGKRSWPLHYHTANEEAIYVLEGKGRVRIGDSEVPVRPGDYVALLSGPDGAHQTYNDSSSTLRYLCISTMIEPEVNFYPESNRVGFFAGSAPGGDREQRFLEGFVPLDASVDYWAGEKSNHQPE